MNRKLIAIAGIALAFPPNVMLSAQEATARTVQYHSQDIVPKQVDVTALQQQYQQAHKQYVDDCVTPMTSGASAALGGKTAKAPTPQQEALQQQKCDQEAKKTGALQQQLQAASQ